MDVESLPTLQAAIKSLAAEEQAVVMAALDKLSVDEAVIIEKLCSSVKQIEQPLFDQITAFNQIATGVSDQIARVVTIIEDVRKMGFVLTIPR